jgi:hypothetical protein
MRCPAHPVNWFKVGFTQRAPEDRAHELSGTGTPEPFLVVIHYQVCDCRAAEREIHQNLEKYRIRSDREFFAAPYEEIRTVVEEVVARYEV